MDHLLTTSCLVDHETYIRDPQNVLSRIHATQKTDGPSAMFSSSENATIAARLLVMQPAPLALARVDSTRRAERHSFAVHQ